MSFTQRDSISLWHPYSPLLQERTPLPVVGAKGAYLELEDGRKLFDGISSWWVNLHGHGHPYLVEALHKQAETLDHVLFAGFTHEPAIRLSEMLLEAWKGTMKRVFFSDNGSTAVESALKLAIQWHQLQGKKVDAIVALDGAFHGDTFGAMSVSGKSIFNDVFEDYLVPVKHLSFPDNETCLLEMEAILHDCKHVVFIYEPLLQGAAGMRVYTPERLNSLMQKVHAAGGICIADEVLTGFGRTGTMFASEQVLEQPDLVCLSKGITGGLMPFAATLVTERMEEPFLSYDKKRIFYHGHSYSANPLACALGIASLELFEMEKTLQRIKEIHACNVQAKNELLGCNHVSKVDVIGTMLAVEFEAGLDSGYLSEIRDKSYSFFLERNLLLRPLGNVSYLLPPYCTLNSELNKVYDAFKEFTKLL
jgi:adenosylmethionine-8-amino-7-oxononanoate aminotransferase